MGSVIFLLSTGEDRDLEVVRRCKIVLPATLDKASTFRVNSASGSATLAITDAMKSASPEVKAFATPLLKKTYASMPGVLAKPNTGAMMTNGANVVRSRIGAIVQLMPGGEEIVQVPKVWHCGYHVYVRQ